jgi:hypothetical protein
LSLLKTAQSTPALLEILLGDFFYSQKMMKNQFEEPFYTLNQDFRVASNFEPVGSSLFGSNQNLINIT